MKRLLLPLFVLISYFSFGQATYNPAQQPGMTFVINKPFGQSQANPLDGRSYKADTINFLYRPFNGTAEVLSYFPVSIPKYRTGQFPVIVNLGGTLNGNGTFTGGQIFEYWWRNGQADSQLVLKAPFTGGVLSFNTRAGAVTSQTGDYTFSQIGSPPTTISGYGITDAVSLNGTQTLTNKTISGISNTITNIGNGSLVNSQIGLSITSNPGADVSVTTTPAALGGSLVINGPTSGTGSRGFLSATDWNTFNGKQVPITLTVVGTSGPATFDGTTLNVPQYTAGTGCLSCNADSLKHLPVDTSSNRNGYALTFDSTNHKLVLAPNGAGTGISALTGDVTASGSGSVAATLATVNSNVGTFGSASTVGQVTVNGKGLTTAASSVAIQIAESQVTNLTTDLAAKQTTTLTSGNILVGNGSNVATSVTPSGDWTISNTGVNTIGANKITYAKIQAASGQGLIGATSAGNYQNIVLGTNLSMTGPILNAASTGLDSTFLRHDSVFDYKSGTGTFRYLVNLGIIDIRKYATGPIIDSVTDMSPAFQRIFNDTSIHGGIIMVPIRYAILSSKIYDTVHTSFNRTFTVRGLGGFNSVQVTGLSAATGSGIVTSLLTSNATDTLFVVNGSSTLNFEDIAIGFTGASLTNTNTAVYYGQASLMHMIRTTIYGFGINLEIKEGFQWDISHCNFFDAHIIDIKIQDSLFIDAGDCRISYCNFGQQTTRANGATHIQYISGGGLMIDHCKFNGGAGTGTVPKNCIDAPFIGTVDMTFDHNSFENFSGYAFWLHPQSISGTNNIIFTGNQVQRFGFANYTGPLISFDGTGSQLNQFKISNNIIEGKGGNDTAIYIANVSDGVISDNWIKGFTTPNTQIVKGTGVQNSVSVNTYSDGTANGMIESGGHLFFDPSYGNLAGITITGNDTLTCINCVFGQQVEINITQNGTGGWHIISASGSVPGGSGPILLNPAAGSVTSLKGFTTGTGFLVTDVSRAYLDGQIPSYKGGLIGDPNFTWNPTVAPNLLKIDGTTNLRGIGFYSGGIFQNDIFQVGTNGQGFSDALVGDLGIETDGHNILIGSTARGSLYTASFGTTGVKWHGIKTGTGMPNLYGVDPSDSSMIQVPYPAGGSGVTTIGTFSNTSIANGGSISGSTLTFGAVDATNPGMVSTGAQTFAGLKTLPAPKFTGVTSAGANDSVLTIDPATGQTHWRTGSMSLFFANGLTAAGGDSVYLGGNLNQNTTLGTAGFNFSITGLPNKIQISTDTSLVLDNTGKMYKSLLTQVGTITKGTWLADAINGQQGGLGRSAYTIGGMYYAISTSNPGAEITPNATTTPMFLTQSGNGTTANAPVWGPSLKYGHTIFTPATGGTVNTVNNQYNIINPSGTLATLTVNLPTSPNNNDVVYIKYTQQVSLVTYGNGTVVDGIAAPAAGGLVILTFDSGTSSWY